MVSFTMINHVALSELVSLRSHY